MSVAHCFTCRRIAKLMLFCTQNILESISKATSLLCFKFFASLAFKSQLLLCWMIILQHLTAAWYFSSSLDCIHVLSQFMLALQTHRQKSLTFVQPHPAVPGLNSKTHCNTVKKKKNPKILFSLRSHYFVMALVCTTNLEGLETNLVMK